MADTPDTPAPKKKGKLLKILAMAGGALVLIGGGVGAGLYAAGAGHHATTPADDRPKLVPKAEETHAASSEGSGGESGDASGSGGGKATPAGSGGEKYASNYYALDQQFTANLQASPHFIQVGIAVSTPYDHKVIDNLKNNEIAVRSAVLMALGDTPEDQVFTSDGKRQLAGRLVKAINDTLQQKEGFGGVGNVYFTNFVVQ